MTIRADGKPMRTSGWREWTPQDIEVQNYCDMKRAFEGQYMAWTMERFQLLKKISTLQRELDTATERLSK